MLRRMRALARRPRLALGLAAAMLVAVAGVGAALPALRTSSPTAEVDRTASAAGKPRARARARASKIQRRADSVEPKPSRAGGDRGEMFHDGCLVDQQVMEWPLCVYGKRRSSRTVVLFGDSQAMQYFPALFRLAKNRGWRLVGRARAGCPPVRIHFAFRCDKWRRGTLRRIMRDRPDLIVVATGTAYNPVKNGRRLGTKASQPVLRRGYVRTLRTLRRTGAPVAVMKATPWAKRDVPTCVARSMDRLRKCAFPRRRNRIFDARAAKAVRGAKLINATNVLCLPRICPAVIEGKLVYRDAQHLSATFARTLAPWLGSRLPRPR